jgi:hypothetical protein
MYYSRTQFYATSQNIAIKIQAGDVKSFTMTHFLKADNEEKILNITNGRFLLVTFMRPGIKFVP